MSVVVSLYPQSKEVRSELSTASTRISGVKTLIKMMIEVGNLPADVCDVLEIAREQLALARNGIEEVLHTGPKPVQDS